MEGAAETQKNEEKMKISQPGEGGGEDLGEKTQIWEFWGKKTSNPTIFF